MRRLIRKYTYLSLVFLFLMRKSPQWRKTLSR
jgi:hypothetical protein